MKIESVFFACLNEVLVQSFYKHYGKDIKRWHGMRLIAVDGSTAYLVHNKEVIKHFGTQANKTSEVPMGQVLSAFDVLVYYAPNEASTNKRFLLLLFNGFAVVGAC